METMPTWDFPWNLISHKYFPFTDGPGSLDSIPGRAPASSSADSSPPLDGPGRVTRFSGFCRNCIGSSDKKSGHSWTQELSPPTETKKTLTRNKSEDDEEFPVSLWIVILSFLNSRVVLQTLSILNYLAGIDLNKPSFLKIFRAKKVFHSLSTPTHLNPFFKF